MNPHKKTKKTGKLSEALIRYHGLQKNIKRFSE
jgi:hypothetical protein